MRRPQPPFSCRHLSASSGGRFGVFLILEETLQFHSYAIVYILIHIFLLLLKKKTFQQSFYFEMLFDFILFEIIFFKFISFKFI